MSRDDCTRTVDPTERIELPVGALVALAGGCCPGCRGDTPGSAAEPTTDACCPCCG
jgi:hypothetical protein